MPSYFFTETASAFKQNTKLFDFVWPTAAAMWNLRWQVAGFLRIVPDATVDQLNARFTEGADIRGANFQRACVDHSWVEQKEAFARILLINTIAIYEGWIDEVLKSMGKHTRTLSDAFQFPDSFAKNGQGAKWAISEITRVESVVMSTNFYSALSNGRYYSMGKLDELLLCYRYFKELRNTDMHRGGIANQLLVDAYNRFTSITKAADLGVAEVPAHHPATLGMRVRISLRGVVGFSHIILKIIATLDAELSRADHAEKAFLSKWKITHPHRFELTANADLRKSHVKRFVKAAGFGKPAAPDKLATWLKQKGLVHF